VHQTSGWHGGDVVTRRARTAGAMPVIGFLNAAFAQSYARFSAAVLKRPEHDPEKWKRFSEKTMLKQRDEIMIRFNPIGS
jgi:hypothetical protein